MYLVDFIKRITRKSNIPVLIYLVLNILSLQELLAFCLGEEQCLSGRHY